jgi:hypothetical protein
LCVLFYICRCTRTWSVIRFCQIGDVRGALCSPNISDLTSDIITAVFNPVVTVKLIFVTKEQKFNAINVTDWLNIFDNVLIVLWFIWVFNATFYTISVISWQSALLVEERGVPIKNWHSIILIVEFGTWLDYFSVKAICLCCELWIQSQAILQNFRNTIWLCYIS